MDLCATEPHLFWLFLCINTGGVPDRFCIFPAEESYMYMYIRSLKQLLVDHWLVWPHHHFYHVHVYTATGYTATGYTATGYKAFVFHTRTKALY